MKKPSLAGALLGHSGTAPEKAWTAVDGPLQRHEVWIAGDPRKFGDSQSDWSRRLSQRLEKPGSDLGVRLRFVVERLTPDLDLVAYTGAVVNSLPGEPGLLFLHAELMIGPEEGLHLAYDNRAPALLTQMFLAHGEIRPTGDAMPATASPYHINLALHDPAIGFAESWNDGTLNYVLQHLGELPNTGVATRDIHQMTMARCDSRTHGISVGIETVRDEFGSFGGSSHGVSD